MRSRLVLAAAFAAAFASTAAGCGSAGAASDPAGSPGAGASVAPAGTAAFVAIDSDANSSQRQALNGLLAKIPGGDALLTKLRQSFEQQSQLSWANDVKPALGPELDIAVLPAASGGEPETVLLTQPNDPSKLDALLAKLPGTPPATAQVDGWTAISGSQAALDTVTGATSHLADSSVYQEASGKLAADALVTAYANGAEARQLVSGLGGSLQPGHEQLVWASGDVVATGGGLRVDGYTRKEGGTATQPYASQLVDEIPSGALAVADFQVHQDTGTQPSSSSPLGGALQSLGKALHGETAVYVSPGAPIPAFTLVTRTSDPQAVLDALQSALSSIGSSAGQGKTGSFGLGSILGALQLSHAIVGQDLVVSTSQAAVDAFKAGGKPLADDDTFKQASSAAGMPDKTTGFVYVNLKDALSAVQGIAALSGGSLPGDLSALRTLTAYGSGTSGGVSSFTVFLEMR